MSRVDELPRLDRELRLALQMREQEGIVDLKCHVDVSGVTDPEDLKRSLLNVFEQENGGGIVCLPVSDIKSFSELDKMIKSMK